MNTRIAILTHGLGTGDADGVALGLDAKVRLLNPRHLGDDNYVVTLAEHVERRIAAAAARPLLQPVAGAQLVKRLLELEERIERVSEQHYHGKASDGLAQRQAARIDRSNGPPRRPGTQTNDRS